MAKLLAVVGQTASGKSALAMKLAKRLDGEIICADSWTVYRGFDIGTAKPSQADRAEVPHHLLDVVEPNDGFSAAVFQELAFAAIDDITSRSKLPILVGGSGLYIDSVLFDYSFRPVSSPQLRTELDALSLEELQDRAISMQLDTNGIDMKNKRRVIRLIENEGVRPTKKPLRNDTYVLGIMRDKLQLKHRIEERIDAMIASGFVEEVSQLGSEYGWDCQPMLAPGYRALAPYVRGEITLDNAKQAFIRNDILLARKQNTWFKRNKSIHWITNRDKFNDTVELITTALNKQ